MRFGMLGPVEAWDGGRQLALGGPQQRALLAALLLNANRVVSTDRLVDYLWGDQPPATARSLLQGCVAGLRRALRTSAGQRLQTAAPGYRLRVEPGELDLDRFEELARTGAGAAAGGAVADLEQAAGLLSDALSLWRGPALDDVDLAGFQPDVMRLEERRLAVLEERIEVDLRLDRQAGLVGELQVHVRAHPLRERLWAQLMLALYRADRQADALEAYRELHRTLVEELGVEPSERVQQLHRAILAGGDAYAEYARARGLPTALAPERAPALAVDWTTPAQLPAAPIPFTGRDRQLKRLDELLSEVGEGLRVAVISGMAGVGKTSLAVRWAHGARQRFGDGQLYVNLRGYAPPPPMRPIEALAGFLRALGVPAERVPADLDQAAALYRSLLADKRVLVMLDNAYSIEQVRPLLPGGPACLVLVTSRERLGGLVAIEGAAHLSLDVLEPAEARDLLARILSEERVQAEPDPTDELARLCAYLPLALRVAAANLAVHPGLRIAEQVTQLAGDRLAALAIDLDEPTAVRGAFDQSYTALPADTRRLFRLLGLVPGPHISPDAAAALAGTEPEQARRLLDRLTRAHLLDQPAAGRYTLHDLVRIYAADRVHDEDSMDDRRAATDRLFNWYLGTTDAAADLLYPEALRLPVDDAAVAGRRFSDHRQALAWLESERANLVAAIEHAGGSGARPFAYRLADALQGFYWLRMHPVEWLTITHAGLAAARGEQDRSAEAAAEFGLGNVHMRMTQHELAIEHFSRALALGRQAGWVEIECRALNGLGVVYRRQWRLVEAVDHFRRALRLARSSGWLAGEAAGLVNLGLTNGDLGDLRQVAGHVVEALRLYRQLGSRGKEALCLGILGLTCLQLGRLEEAEGYNLQAIALAREAGDRSTEVEAQVYLAAVYSDAGRYEEAVEAAETGLAGAREIGDYGIEPTTLVTLGWIHYHLGRYRRAATNFGQARTLAFDSQDPGREAQALIGLATAMLRLDRVGEASDASHRALSLARQSRDLVEEGRALTALAAVDVAGGRVDDAAGHANRAIEIHRRTGHRLGEARALRELAAALDRRGDADAATASRRLAHELFTEIGSPEAGTVGFR